MFDVPGYRVVRVLGAVYGLTVRTRNWAASLGMVLKSVAGGELRWFTNMVCPLSMSHSFSFDYHFLVVMVGGVLFGFGLVGCVYSEVERKRGDCPSRLPAFGMILWIVNGRQSDEQPVLVY
jgi:hypothetical protein